MPRRKQGDRSRPHVCESKTGGLGPAHRTEFASHDTLAMHLIREHLVRLADVNRCDVDCPMLLKVEA